MRTVIASPSRVVALSSRRCGTRAEPWKVEVSEMTRRTNNPIRKIVEELHPPSPPPKEIIPLSLGECCPAAPGRCARPA